MAAGKKKAKNTLDISETSLPFSSQQTTPWNQLLQKWFIENQRTMPWRSNPLPYYVWISEIMLQQTQVDTVIPYFNRFISAFPTVESLANADQEQVLKLWEGLGYYSRARNLHKAAKIVVTEWNSQLPVTYKEIQTIPGIGPYCAAAILSIAFNQPIPVVDGNVLRVFTRFWGIDEDIRKNTTRDTLFQKLTPFIEDSVPTLFNQGIMELGALICSPKNPKCNICPLSGTCYANQHSLQDQLPVKSPSKKVPHYTIGVGIIFKDNNVCIAKRKQDQMLGGLWEFPGGKQKDNETLEETVIREIKEETHLNVTIQKKLCQVNHAYSHFKITMHAFICDYVSGKEKNVSSDEIKWVPLSELENHPFPKANKVILGNLLEHP